MKLPTEIRKLRCGYATLNKTRQVCLSCGRKTSLYIKSEHRRICTMRNCPSNKKKEVQPKKIDVVEEMDRIERRESLEEGKKEAKKK